MRTRSRRSISTKPKRRSWRANSARPRSQSGETGVRRCTTRSSGGRGATTRRGAAAAPWRCSSTCSPTMPGSRSPERMCGYEGREAVEGYIAKLRRKKHRDTYLRRRDARFTRDYPGDGLRDNETGGA